MTTTPDVFPRAISLAVHELRTPVTVVSGYLRMLLREQGGPISDKQRKMLEEAERSCARLSALVTEMSDLGKLEGHEISLAQQDFDIASTLTDLAGNMQEGQDRGVTLELCGADRPIIVHGDRTRTAAALSVLMRAALRERGEPGAIVVECSTMQDAGRSWAVVAMGDRTVLPVLMQAATGAPPAFDEWRGGLGMALPIARRVIEAQGGALWSAVGTQSRAASALRLPLRT